MEVLEVKRNSLLDIVVVGACFCDLQTFVGKYPKPGETVKGRKFQLDFGGKGANTCVMAAKLGAKTAMVSLVGEDVFGRETMENFRKFGVNTECVKVTTEAATGITNCIVDDDGEPSFICVAGASMCLTTAHVNDAKHIIQHSKVLISNRGVPLHTSLEALKLAKRYGVVTIFNPSPRPSELHDEFYTNTDIFMLNMDEAAILTKTKVTDRSEAEDACVWFHNKGVPYVVLTMRENGAIMSVHCGGKDSYNSNMKTLFIKAIYKLKNQESLPTLETEKDQGKRVFHVPTKKVNVVDTTGAGDALAGTFAYFLSCYPHLSLKEIMTRSVSIATHTVQIEGVQKSYPCHESLPNELFA